MAESPSASYQVLARKWRPQQFSEVSGQEHVIRTLSNAVLQGRVAHAYLFCGPRGVGKTSAARLLAKALNCQQGPTPQPCGQCLACVEITTGASVDVAEIDGASNNGVDDVRALRENSRYLPARDRFKIYIIDEVHMLSQAAFNALLKTLEEPPPHVKFILATTEAHKVPETIVSRCQLHHFRRIPLSQMVARLKSVAEAEGFGLSDEALTVLARQAEGGLRDGLSLLDQVVSACGPNPSPAAVAETLGAVDRGSVSALVGALCRRDAAQLIQLLSEQHERGVEPKRLCETLCQELRHLLVTRITGTPPPQLPDHEQREMKALAQLAEPAQLARLFDLTHDALAEMGRAFEPQLALEVALLKAIFLAPGSDVSELLARTETLLRGSSPSVVPVPANSPSRGSDAEAKRASLRPAPLPSPVVPANPKSEPVASSPPPPSVARAEPTKEDSLNALAAAVFAHSPRLGTALKHGRLRGLSGGELALAYPPGDFRAAQLLAEKETLEPLLTSHFGVPTRLRICEDESPQDEPSQAEREAREAEGRSARIRDSALQSEGVREAVRILGGTVEEVRVLSSESNERRG